MKPFGEWFADFGKQKSVEETQLPEGVWLHNGKYMVKCCVCERDMEIGCDIADYPMEGDDNWCGGSPSCCP
jgi:hypothetical protein